MANILPENIHLNPLIALANVLSKAMVLLLIIQYFLLLQIVLGPCSVA